MSTISLQSTTAFLNPLKCIFSEMIKNPMIMKIITTVGSIFKSNFNYLFSYSVFPLGIKFSIGLAIGAIFFKFTSFNSLFINFLYKTNVRYSQQRKIPPIGINDTIIARKGRIESVHEKMG